MENHKNWVRKTFDCAALHYGEGDNSFFSYFGERLVAHAAVSANVHALDVATGRGAVLFPLAQIIGQAGELSGIDISSQMLQESASEAQRRNFDWINFQQMDAEKLSFSNNSFDFVFCGFALFFFPSLATALSEFMRVLKP